MRCFLVDNGSLRPASWANLASVAARVSALSRIEVRPASVLHSTRIPLEDIPPGVPVPTTWERAIKAGLEDGETEYWVLPFFFGATGAITEYLPQREAALRERFGDFTVRYAPFLADDVPPTISAPGLVDLLADRVRSSIAVEALVRPPVILVDHGSPKPEVAAVRDRLAEALAEILGEEVAGVTPASMERREGDQYAFNEPLLETALRALPADVGPVVVAHLFLSPGRHAGEGGDIAEICAAAEAERSGLRVIRSDLLGNHPRMPELVAARLEMLRAQTSV
jgi:sirohydrochlorin ferrochelatase